MASTAPQHNSPFKRLWSDPVWSKVIAGAILAVSAALGGYSFREIIATLVQLIVHQQGLVISAFASILLAAFIWRYTRLLAQKRILKAELKISIDETFPHAPSVHIDVHNYTRKPVFIAAVEFVTKEHWDMPDPCRRGETGPVVKFLPSGAAFVKISPQKDSVAQRAVGKTIESGRSLTISFRLTTDHAPEYGIGLFPFHLGVELVCGKSDHRLSLPDLIVSLHGHIPLSMATYSEPVISVGLRPGDLQHYASAVLSKATDGVLCPPEILTILKAKARV